MLALEGLRPTSKGRREALRMTSEKPAAMVEGALAAQKRMFEAGLKFWGDQLLAGNALLLAAPAVSVAAAVPMRRRVRRNSKRLTGW
jgi:hypothetical protein